MIMTRLAQLRWTDAIMTRPSPSDLMEQEEEEERKKGKTKQVGEGRTGQDRTGQDRTGQDRTGQDRTGQDRTGQDSPSFRGFLPGQDWLRVSRSRGKGLEFRV